MMTSVRSFDDVVDAQERRLLSTLSSPGKIQDFLDQLPYSTEPIYRCPLRVLRDRLALCFDGALFAAASLRRIGFPPLILEMIPDSRDDDHLLALFKFQGRWDAIAKSNFIGLRFREPIFRTLRELVLSYFEQNSKKIQFHRFFKHRIKQIKTLQSDNKMINLIQ